MKAGGEAFLSRSSLLILELINAKSMSGEHEPAWESLHIYVTYLFLNLGREASAGDRGRDPRAFKIT